MKVRKILTKLFLVLCSLAVLAGCMPDSLTKWEKPAEVKPNSGSTVTGPDGTPINVPPPTTGSGPSSFSYRAATMGFPTGHAVSESPTIIGAPEGITNTYVFSSYDADFPTTPKSLSTVGLTLNAGTGKISGTPSAYAPETNFVIKAYHVNSGKTLTTTLGIGVATDLTAIKFYYPQTVGRRLILTLPNVSSFTEGGWISNSEGSVGTVEYVDATLNQLHIEVTASANTKGFQDGDPVDNVSIFVLAETTITSVSYAIPTSTGGEFAPTFSVDLGTGTSSEAYSLNYSITPDPTGGTGLNFESDTTVETKGTFTVPINSDSLVATTYTVTVTNSINQSKSLPVRFSISNAPQNLSINNKALLQVDDNSFFNVGDTITSSDSGSGFGRVERKFSNDHLLVAVKSGEFNVDATVDSVSPYLTPRALITKVDMINAIMLVAAGSGAGFGSGSGISVSGSATTYGVVVAKDTTSTVSMTVTDAAQAANWSAGDMIVGRTSGGIVDSDNTGVGNVLAVNSATMLVNMISGTFLTLNCLENRASWVGNGATCAPAVPATGPAISAVNGVPTLLDTLYVRVVSGNFKVANNICPTIDGSAGTGCTPLLNVFADNLKLTLASGANFKRGYNITNEFGAAGVVDTVSTNDVTVMVDNGNFSTGQNIDKYNPYTGATTTISGSNIYTRQKFNAYVREPLTLKPSLSQGDNVTYRLGSGVGYSTILPTGLTLDISTGIISGTPTQPFASTHFQLQARNAVCSTGGAVICPSYSFYLEVFDHFTLENFTDNALSYKLHKTGQSRHTTPCRITTAQLNAAPLNGVAYQESKDITCFLEAGELDLYMSGLKLKTNVGGGMCNFISMRPYQFFNYQYAKSNAQISGKKVYTYSIDPACVTCDDPQSGGVGVACSSLSNGSCDSDHRTVADQTLPNCDDGTYIPVSVTIALPTCQGGDVTTTVGAATTCGGSISKCINGPAKEHFSDAELDLGVNSKITDAGSGISGMQYIFTSPLNRGLVTNAYLANFEKKNTCGPSTSPSTYYAAAWQTYAQGTYYQVVVDNKRTVKPGDVVTASAAAASGIVDSVYTAKIDSDNNGSLDADVLIIRATAGTMAQWTGAIAGTGGATNVIGTTVYAYDNPFRRAQPFYDFNCLNAAFDTIGRIRLIVRDWDRAFNSTSRIDRVNPDDIASTIPGFMDVSALDDFGNAYNNRADWDNDTGADFTAASCTNTSTPPYSDNSAPANYNHAHSFLEDSL